VAALALAILCAHWALRGHWSRLACWAASVALVSFTRDVAAIAVFAAFWTALVTRTRRSVALAVTGLLAAAPAPLLFGASIRKTLAFTFSGNQLPSDESWHFIASQYGHSVAWMLGNDFPFRTYPALAALTVGLVAVLGSRPATAGVLRSFLAAIAVAGAALLIVVAGWPGSFLHLLGPAGPRPFPAGIVLVAALLPLFLSGRDDDHFLMLARGGAIAAAAYIFVLPQYTQLRLALVMLPFAALGIARAIELGGPAHSSDEKIAPSRFRSATLIQVRAPAGRPS
jgi:hypothetical protein